MTFGAKNLETYRCIVPVWCEMYFDILSDVAYEDERQIWTDRQIGLYH